MPNAQTHRASVCALLDRPAIQQKYAWLAADDQARGAFLLGAISPDVRAVSGQPREVTHFFTIPPTGERPAHLVMLDRYPDLHSAPGANPLQTAFVAGYITHLVMDETWLDMIVMPYLFIEGKRWGLQHPNWRLYSLLMTWLEYRAAENVTAETWDLLSSAEPEGWLPFVTDRHLRQWRNHVVRQVQKGGARLISALFASTNGITPRALEQIVLSPGRMAQEAFEHVAREQLVAFEQTATEHSEAAVIAYLA